MAASDGDANGAVLTDNVFNGLGTQLQRDKALLVRQLAGKFPWEMLPACCIETKWTQSLLDKFSYYIFQLYSGPMSDEQLGGLRTALSEQLEDENMDRRKRLTLDILRHAYNQLKRAAAGPASSNRRYSQRHTRRSSINEPTSAETTRRTSSSNKLDSARASGTKRTRAEQESPTHVMSTRSSKRLRPETPPNITAPESPKTPETSRMRRVRGFTEPEENDEEEKSAEDNVNVENGDEDDGDDDTEEEDQTEEHPEAQDIQQSPAGQDDTNDESTETHDAEETTLGSVTADTTQSDPEQSSASPARTSQVAELTMTDEDIANNIRRYIGSIVHRQQSAAARKLLKHNAEHKRAKQNYAEAHGALNGARMALIAAKEQLGKASEQFTKAHSDLEIANETFANIQKLTFESPVLSAEMQRTVDRAQASYRETLSEKEAAIQEANDAGKRVEEAGRVANAAEIKLGEQERLLNDFRTKEGNERRFKCVVHVETDARDESDELFPEFELKFDSIISRGERSPS
ncbi:hypothetical protein NW762_011518 [Fusarium torreyae]|uniref:Uncharacterized protein n=1 Tax=Fusarium torreyae TaxID=1237075 RepID=A0A9W8RTR8_9HYPO|nr:hypothetical protein NW762_011518 [Fusarium torreyae]